MANNFYLKHQWAGQHTGTVKRPALVELRRLSFPIFPDWHDRLCP